MRRLRFDPAPPFGLAFRLWHARGPLRRTLLILLPGALAAGPNLRGKPTSDSCHTRLALHLGLTLAGHPYDRCVGRKAGSRRSSGFVGARPSNPAPAKARGPARIGWLQRPGVAAAASQTGSQARASRSSATPVVYGLPPENLTNLALSGDLTRAPGSTAESLLPKIERVFTETRRILY